MTRRNSPVLGLLSGLLAGAMVPLMLMPAPAAAQNSTVASKKGTDVLILRKGTVLTGTIESETATAVKFTSDYNGLPFTTEYPKTDILEIKRGAAAPAGGAAPEQATPAPASLNVKVAEDPPVEAASDKTRYAYVTLTGVFGQGISQTPIRKAMKDAVSQRAQVIVFELENTWEQRGGSETKEEKRDIEARFDEFHRAEEILDVIGKELPDMATDAGMEPPRVVFWVRRAMGGAAFFPLMSKEVYFHPEGRVGGIGNLATMLKGHERVVEKQISLRLKRAVGWAHLSGYPYAEDLVRAMTQDWYVCSVKFENGRPVLFEGLPTNPGEELLTDDAKEGNRDTIDQIARHTGNDVLILNERNAKLIGFSKGTVETKSELLAALRLDRAGVDVGARSERDMTDWRTGLDRTMARVQELWREYAEVRVEGDWEARRRARSTQIQKLEALKAIFRQWGEGLDPYQLAPLGIPIGGDGTPDLAIIDNWIEKIRMQQQLDRR